MVAICRLAQRWGLTNGASVEQTECDCKHLWPEACWNALHLRLIYFGRGPCPAKGHDPQQCPICTWAAVSPHDRCPRALQYSIRPFQLIMGLQCLVMPLPEACFRWRCDPATLNPESSHPRCQAKG